MFLLLSLLIAAPVLGMKVSSQTCETALQVRLAPEVATTRQSREWVDPEAVYEGLRSFLTANITLPEFLAAVKWEPDSVMQIFSNRFADENRVSYDFTVSRGSLLLLQYAAEAGNREVVEWLMNHLVFVERNSLRPLNSGLGHPLDLLILRYPKLAPLADNLARISDKQKSFLKRSPSGVDFVFVFQDFDFSRAKNYKDILEFAIVITPKGNVRVYVSCFSKKPMNFLKQDLYRAYQITVQQNPGLNLDYSIVQNKRGSKYGGYLISFPASEMNLERTTAPVEMVFHFLSRVEFAID